MWKGWAYCFYFFNKINCLYAIYLSNCNHLLPPPLLFPFGEKQLLEITSVSCEFWRRSQEYKNPCMCGQIWPSRGTWWHSLFSAPRTAWCQQHLLETGAKGLLDQEPRDQFSLQLLLRVRHPCWGWGCTFTIPAQRRQWLDPADKTQCSHSTPI